MSHIVIDARIISSTTGRYVERLLHYLEKIDTINTYTVLVRKKDQGYWVPTNPNFSVQIADYKSFTFSEQLTYWWQLRKLNADLVHFSQIEQPLLYRGKKITTIHDLTLLKTYNPDKNWFVYHAKQLVGRFAFRTIVKTSDAILTPSDFTKQEIVARYQVAEQKIHRTHLAAEMKTTVKRKYLLPTGDFIMFVGQQSEYKNIRRLAAAHQQLLKTRSDLQLVLVGKIDNPAKRNQRFFESKNYKNIIFTGFVDDDQLNWLYAHTAAYLFPSLMEGFGLPGLEAMMHGAPVLSSNATCLPEVYGDAALYFNPTDTNDMARKIDQVLSDSTLRTRLIESGHKQVALYSWQKTAEQTYAVYQDVLATTISEQ